MGFKDDLSCGVVVYAGEACHTYSGPELLRGDEVVLDDKCWKVVRVRHHCQLEGGVHEIRKMAPPDLRPMARLVIVKTEVFTELVE